MNAYHLCAYKCIQLVLKSWVISWWKAKPFEFSPRQKITVPFNSQKDAMHLTDNDWRGFHRIASPDAREDKENNSPFRILWGNDETLSAMISNNME